jgi:hypothetical protein
MQPITIVFSLFGLLLGLSLAAVLSGFGRAVRMRPRVHMGWLTPLLGLFVMLDLTSFWHGAWRAQDYIRPEYGFLFVALVVSSVYYLAASCVFPESATTVAEFDAHYFDNRRWIFLAIAFCNLVVFGWEDWLERDHLPLAWWFSVPEYFALVMIAAFVRSRALSIACLVGLIGIFLFLASRSLGLFIS